MKNDLSKYGVQIVPRPKIVATKKLSLEGEEGEELVRKLTIQTLKNHKNTYAKLANM